VFRRYQFQPVDRAIALINPVLRGWVNYFTVGHSGECFRAQPKHNPDLATLAADRWPSCIELGDPNRNIPPCVAYRRPGSGASIEAPFSPSRTRWPHENVGSKLTPAEIMDRRANSRRLQVA
jgi:Group II intron, maturase-specific domain